MSMEEKDVAELGKDLLKSDADGSFLQLSLRKLKTGVKPTEDLLRQTKIGVAVAKLKQHKDPEVARQAAALVSSWRTAIKSKEKKTGSPAGPNGAATPSRSGTPSVATPAAARSPAPSQKQQAAAPAASKAPSGKRDTKSDGVDMNKTGDTARDGSLTLIYNGLAFMSEERRSHPSQRQDDCATRQLNRGM